MPDRTCNLECVKKNKKRVENDEDEKDNVVEFVGPVKIVFVEQKITIAYIRVVWYAAAIAMAEMLLATVTILIYFFSLSYKRKAFMKGLHAVFGTLGLQTCLLAGILGLNPFSGSAMPQSIPARIVEHRLVQFFGLLSSIAATYCAYLAGFERLLSFHSISGVAAIAVSILASLSGLCLCKSCGHHSTPENTRVGFCLYIHLVLGVIAPFVSSSCLVSGITKKILKKWLPESDMYTYMIASCLFYTTVVVYKPFGMLLTRRTDSFMQ